MTCQNEPLSTLNGLRLARSFHDDAYEAAERKAVLAARAEDASWEDIARAVGRRRSSVWEKYHKVDPKSST